MGEQEEEKKDKGNFVARAGGNGKKGKHAKKGRTLSINTNSSPLLFFVPIDRDEFVFISEVNSNRAERVRER